MGLGILIFLFIALPIVIYGTKKPEKFVYEVAILDEYARDGNRIADNALILTANGFLGEYELGFIYAGRMVENNLPVAIKFFPEDNYDDGGSNEYLMFIEMEAVNNTGVEQFGIPVVYHQGKWEHFMLIAITKFDESLDDIKEKKTIYPMDVMILLKNFVIQSRHMHNHGVCHADLRSNKIRIRFHQSFIIDFSKAEMIGERDAYLLTHRDWIEYINTILGLCNVKMSGSWDNFKSELPNKILDRDLLSVIKEFGDEAFSTDREKHFPNYYRLEEFINNKIREHGRKTDFFLMFSWFANR